MLESLPAGAGHAVLVVDGPDDLQPTTAAADSLTWVVGAPSADADAAITGRCARVRRSTSPASGPRWRAGATCCALVGVPDEQVTWKAYWSRSAANAAHGEPAREG